MLISPLLFVLETNGKLEDEEKWKVFSKSMKNTRFKKLPKIPPCKFNQEYSSGRDTHTTVLYLSGHELECVIWIWTPYPCTAAQCCLVTFLPSHRPSHSYHSLCICYTLTMHRLHLMTPLGMHLTFGWIQYPSGRISYKLQGLTTAAWE